MKTPLMSSKSGGKAPQCRVCGDESSGFHYGVDSCEGCKGFFRRCITQGMNHKCANEEKCDITPFTRNSCQYCRLKKCFEVGMSREASRLGRRPKRLKEVGGAEGSGGGGGARVHVGNIPIAPYPSQQDLYKMRMTELQKILHNNGSFKEELMQAFLTAAKASFQEHSKTGGGSGVGGSGEGMSGTPTPCSTQTTVSQQQLINISACVTSLASTSTSSGGGTMERGLSSAGGSRGDGGVMGDLGVSVDSPSSHHSPGGSMIDLSNLAALDSFLFEQGMPGTPGGGGAGGGLLLSSLQQVGGMDVVGELQAANSPFNLSNVSLDPVSNATSPLSDLCAATTPSPHHPGGGMGSSSDMLSASNGMNDLLNQNNTPLPGTSSPGAGVPTSLQSQLAQYHQYQQAFQQQQQQQQMAATISSAMLSAADDPGMVQVKSEPPSTPLSCFSPAPPPPSTASFVKTEPISPEPVQPCSSSSSVSLAAAGADVGGASVWSPPYVSKLESQLFCEDKWSDTNVAAIMAEVRQTPSETRRLLIEQVTDAVVDAHMTTTTTSSKHVEEANLRLGFSANNDIISELSNLTLNPKDIWQKFISAMVPEITRVVKFCKKLPGFVEIEQDDQIVLIKQGAFEVMMTRFAQLVDHEKQTMMDPTLTTRSPRRVIREMPMGEFLDEFFFVASHFNPLKMTDGEVGLFTSVLIICPARIGLKNTRAVKKIQSLFQQALYFLMKHNHSDPDLKYSQLMSLVSTFHRINEEHFKTLNNIRLSSHKEIESQLPELHREIFNNSYLEGNTD